MMKALVLTTILTLVSGLYMSVWGMGDSYVICGSDKAVLPEASVTLCDSKLDSIGHVVATHNGRIVVNNASAVYLLAEYPDYTSTLTKRSELTTDTIFLSPAYKLDELVVNGQLMTQHLTHQSFKIPLSSMKSYPTFYRALNEIPNLVVLNSGDLFYEGNTNVMLLLNGVETNATELSALDKSDISRVDVYQTPPARFIGRGVASVIDIITKDSLIGGNASININQSPYPLSGNNSAALFYNYKRSRFSAIFSNSNSHYKKTRQNEELNYTFDGIDYSKRKEGLDSKEHKDNNNLTLSFQNNKQNSYLYNLKIGGSVNREKRDMNQNVFSNIMEERLTALNKLSTSYNQFWVSNYFEKNLGGDKDMGLLEADVKFQRYYSRYASSYQEFITDQDNALLADASSAYKIMYDAVWGEADYIMPEKKWGLLSFCVYDVYKYSKYRDIVNPFYQKNNQFGTLVNYRGRKGKFFYNMSMAVKCLSTSSLLAPEGIEMWMPAPSIGVYYYPSNSFQFRFNYSYDGDIPSIAMLSETDQWVDTKLVYHGNSKLKPYKTHNASLTGVTATKYLDASLYLAYSYAPDMICNYFKYTPDYVLETMVNLAHYSTAGGQLDFSIKPLGTNRFTIWTRLIGEKIHGRGDDYKWDGYRYQWMSSISYYMPKWSVELFYQYPGKVAVGQLIMPRAQYWSVSAEYRPVENLTLGLSCSMPFGKSFTESERTVGSALVSNVIERSTIDMTNMFKLSLSWNVSFGKNHNYAQPKMSHGDDDTGILKK